MAPHCAFNTICALAHSSICAIQHTTPRSTSASRIQAPSLQPPNNQLSSSLQASKDLLIQMEETHFAILAIVRIAIGLTLCFHGYRLLRYALVATALFSGGAFLALLVTVLLDNHSSYWVVFFVGGLLCSALAVFHIQSGVFLVGFCGGTELATLVIGMLINTSESEAGSSTVQLLCISAAGLVGGLCTIKLKKPALLMALSFVGTSLLATGVRYFVDKKIVKNALKTDSELNSSLEPTDDNNALQANLRTSWWILCAISLVLFALGALVQFESSREVDHDALVDKLQFKRKSADEDGDEGGRAPTELHFEPLVTPREDNSIRALSKSLDEYA